jgi:N utilization substance protein B
MSTRREARERTLQALYARELSGDSADHVIETALRPGLEDPKHPQPYRFAERLFLRTLDHAEEADALIVEHVRNWELDRIALLDRLVLRMAITEILYFDDIPPKVTINEAIEVAKAFSTDRSGPFVNGILDATLKGLREQGRVKKSGRGLIEVSNDAFSEEEPDA